MLELWLHTVVCKNPAQGTPACHPGGDSHVDIVISFWVPPSLSRSKCMAAVGHNGLPARGSGRVEAELAASPLHLWHLLHLGPLTGCTEKARATAAWPVPCGQFVDQGPSTRLPVPKAGPWHHTQCSMACPALASVPAKGQESGSGRERRWRKGDWPAVSLLCVCAYVQALGGLCAFSCLCMFTFISVSVCDVAVTEESSRRAIGICIVGMGPQTTRFESWQEPVPYHVPRQYFESQGRVGWSQGSSGSWPWGLPAH